MYIVVVFITGSLSLSSQLRERLSLMRVAESEVEEKRRKDITIAKQVCMIVPGSEDSLRVIQNKDHIFEN